jgi:hypothetical protein
MTYEHSGDQPRVPHALAATMLGSGVPRLLGSLTKCLCFGFSYMTICTLVCPSLCI